MQAVQEKAERKAAEQKATMKTMTESMERLKTKLSSLQDMIDLLRDAHEELLGS